MKYLIEKGDHHNRRIEWIDVVVIIEMITKNKPKYFMIEEIKTK